MKNFLKNLYEMNEIVDKFLLTGDKFMPEKHLRRLGFTYSAFCPFTKSKEKFKHLCKQEIQIIFIKISFRKFVFSMIWHMTNSKI